MCMLLTSVLIYDSLMLHGSPTLGKPVIIRKISCKKNTSCKTTWQGVSCEKVVFFLVQAWNVQTNNKLFQQS